MSLSHASNCQLSCYLFPFLFPIILSPFILHVFLNCTVAQSAPMHGRGGKGKYILFLDEKKNKRKKLFWVRYYIMAMLTVPSCSLLLEVFTQGIV